jgi:HSP20 family protein
MDKRKRDRDWRRGFFDDFFTDFDEEFDRMRERMDKIFQHAMREPTFGEDMTKKPFVYGFSVRVGPDGIPHIQEFGNTKPIHKALTEKDGLAAINEREPLTDVIESEDEICITIELPGVEKKDIDLDASDDSVTIDVDTEDRKYHKNIPMPGNIDPDSVSATYKNGVLDISIKRKKKEEKKGKRIDIQ